MNATAASPRHTELQTLIRDHNSALVSYIYGWTHNRADAHDIAQEAYARLCKSTHLPVRHLRGLLFTTARNIAIDWQRKRRTRETYSHEHVLRLDELSPSPEHIWVAREDWAALQRAIENLPPKARKALRLVREQGVEYEVVAKRMGIKTHSARRLVERAMEQLETVV